METIVNGVRRHLPLQRPRDIPPMKFQLRRPTAAVFFTCYAAVWLGGAIFLQTKYLPFLSLSIWNMSFVCINMLGFLIAATTGWAPWRDRDR